MNIPDLWSTSRQSGINQDIFLLRPSKDIIITYSETENAALMCNPLQQRRLIVLSSWYYTVRIRSAMTMLFDWHLSCGGKKGGRVRVVHIPLAKEY